MTTYAERRRLRALDLYLPAGACPTYRQMLSMAQRRGGRCPICGALVMAGPITPDRALAMLRELEGERRRLGLEVRH